MTQRIWSIFLIFLLVACGNQTPERPAAPTESQSAEAPLETPVMGPERHILAFGDSLFAGYGLNDGESYPARLEAALRVRGINARIANAGVSGDTTAAGLQRLTFTLDAQTQTPDLVLLELGGNDMLRNLQPSQTRANLSAMLEELAKRKIPVLLMGMRAPPNLGADYMQKFDAIYPALAEQYGAQLYPFFLQTTYDKPELIQADRIHPTAQGIEVLVTATIDSVVKALPPKA